MQFFKAYGHVCFWVFFFFALFFYQERVINCDTSFFLFKIIHFEFFNVEAGRYATVIPQAIPLLGIFMGASLKTVMALFSVSFLIVYYLIFCTINKMGKDHGAGLLLVLLFLVGVKHSFYYASTETQQSMAYAALFFAWICKMAPEKQTRIKDVLISLLLIALCFFAHPSSAFVMLAIIVFSIIQNARWRWRWGWMMIILCPLMLLAKITLTKEGSYEGNLFGQSTDFYSIFNSFFSLYTLEFFVTRFWQLFALSMIIFLTICWFYFWRRQYKKLIFYVFSVLGFFLITCLTYQEGGSDMFMEKNYMPWNFLILFPFVFEVTSSLSNVVWVKMGLLLLGAVGLFQINQGGIDARKRLEKLDGLLIELEHFPERKFVLTKEVFEEHGPKQSWTIFCESLLYTTIEETRKPTSLYVVEDLKSLAPFDMQKKTLLLAAPFWPVWDTDSLNTRYFHLKESAYRTIASSKALKENVVISFEKEGQ